MSTVGTYRDIALLLRVKSNQVYMWHKRRANNGFPEPVACCIAHRTGPKGAPMFDLQQVIDWFVDYEPAKGGAPKGNTFALKHGQYINSRGTRTPEEVERLRSLVSA